MSRDPLPYPPQMRNGGSPPAHLSSSSDSHAAVERAVATTAAAMKTATDLAVERIWSEFAASWAAMLAELAAADKANKQHCHETAEQENALANDAKAQRCQELAERAAALAELVLAVERRFQESADRTAVSAEMTLADERRHRDAVKRRATLREMALAKEQCRSLLAAQAAELALAPARVAVLAVMVHKAQAPPTTTLPHPEAMLSTPSRPMTYVGVVFFTMVEEFFSGLNVGDSIVS
jgi:hypothetical protein